MSKISREVELEISNGAITLPAGSPWVKFWHVVVDTEGQAASDDLDAIHGGDISDIVILRLASSARPVTVRDNMPIGPAKIGAQGIFQLNQNKDKMMLVRRDQNVWDELSRSPN